MSSPPTLSQPGESPESQKIISASPVPSPDNTSQSDDSVEPHNGDPPASSRPMRKYTRHQLVLLSSSPLVMPPPNMPELKVWFGFENESPQKKDDPPTSSTARERRFRRDAEDGDVPARPTFRTALTQPSQMGNFKHQSLRPSDRDRDRDRDRDGEKEREREIRDKEGHERLRHLSDKFDRDRLALPLAARKDRDVAPHLNVNSSRTPQPLSSNAASRRADTREATKKKVGEASEDWRRGAEPPRPGREDRAENGRERTRDSSRPKRDMSNSRRDRDELREKAPRGDRERDDHRRDKDADGEEDPRRWRDDGKREERVATSRRERGRDKPNNDHSWEGTTDKRWPTSDDRGYKRSSARDRKPGNSDDAKDKDERRDKEREKEKEPAWMDTYVPSESTQGILGGHSSTGELDGIQAWKKGLKEKESREKEAIMPPKLSLIEKSLPSPTLPVKSEGVMDEIQLFKLLMKQEEEKKKTDSDEAVPKNDRALHQLMKQDNASVSTQQNKERTLEDTPGDSFALGANTEVIRPQAQNTPSTATTSTDPPSFPPGLKDHNLPGKPLTEPPLDRPFPQGRGLTNLGASQDLLQPAVSKPVGESNPSSSFQPPPGSRLLAFARPPIKGSSSGNPINTMQSLNGVLPDSSQGFAQNETVRPQPGFSPFDDQTRQHYGFDEPREVNIPHSLNALSRASLDQNFSSNVNAQMEPNYNGPAAKGSRFAKFFDGKGREGPPSSGKPQLPVGFTSPSPNLGQRQDHTSVAQGNPGDRAMDELFAMLNNSSQRGNIGPHSNPLMSNNGAFGSPGPNLHALQQQHLLSQTQQHHNSRLEPLYDSRSDDRSFVPDGMVPGLRPIPPPPPRGRDGHFVDHVEDSMNYSFQRMPPPHNQQPQPRNLEPVYPGPAPLYAQQGRPNAGLNLQNLQQPQYRGGPSPNSNQGVPISNGPQQRLPPGLANLGGRPPHEPTQFLGMPNLPSTVPHNPLHGNPQLQAQQLPFNNFNATNNIGFNGLQVRGPVPGPHLHNTGTPQHPLGNNGHPSMDPRLSNHHHLMGLGGSGVGGNRINGGFPQQGPTLQPHLPMRPQQQQQQQQNHLPPHMLPHLMPPHLQQGHPGSNNQSHDLMALLLGGPHRE